jgi:branched-chain amino acid transport system ATP-binding protein
MTEAVLEITDLQKSFGALKATDGVNLTLKPGEIHALIGPNGAGKSTLIHQICGTLRQDSGSIHLAGRDIGNLGTAERARLGLGRTFQISSLAGEFNALRNVMLAVQARQGSSFHFFRPVMRDASLTDIAMQKLERVGLGSRANVPAAELSHGEKRQLEIAIALALDVKAFLLDEPMAGMGPEGSKSLTKFLDGLRHEAPILLVEHDMDAVYVYGRIIATGCVDEIRNDPAVRSAYLGDHA